METEASTERILRTIAWSDQSYSFEAFLNNSCFPLPQLVQVESGIYSEDDAKTLSSGQILTLHLTKRTDKILGKLTGGKEVFIPINFPLKVEILPTVCEDIYYSVQDVVDAICVKFIRVVHDAPPTYKVKAGDILEIKKTIEENHEQYIECEFVNKTRDSVKLPLDYKASFEPLAETEQYYLFEALHKFNLPVRVKFISSDDILNAEISDENDWPSIGSVLLKERIEESTVICTSHDEGIVTVLMVPTDLDVSVNPALGAVVNDKAHTRFCRSIHDGVDLQKAIELSKMKGSKLYAEVEVDVEVLYDYEEVKPMIPARSPKHPQDCEDEAEYRNATPNISPRKSVTMRPPKPKPRLRPKENSSKHSNKDASSQCVSPVGNVSLNEDANSLPQIQDEHFYYETDTSDQVDDDVSEKQFRQTTTTGPPEGNDKVDAHSDDDNVYQYAYARVVNYHDIVSEEQPARVPSDHLTKALGFPPCEIPCSDNTNTTALAPSSTSDFPDDLSQLSVSEVGECLRKLNLEKYMETFASHQIDGEMFSTLNDKSFLISVGVGNAFHRKKILKFIHGWRPKFQKN